MSWDSHRHCCVYSNSRSSPLLRCVSFIQLISYSAQPLLYNEKCNMNSEFHQLSLHLHLFPHNKAKHRQRLFTMVALHQYEHHVHCVLCSWISQHSFLHCIARTGYTYAKAKLIVKNRPYEKVKKIVIHRVNHKAVSAADKPTAVVLTSIQYVPFLGEVVNLFCHSYALRM